MTLAQRLQTPLKPSRSNRFIALLGTRSILLPAIILGLRLASPATADISYLVLAGYALFGRQQAIQALFVLWLITMLSPGLAPESSIGGGAGCAGRGVFRRPGSLPYGPYYGPAARETAPACRPV